MRSGPFVFLWTCVLSVLTPALAPGQSSVTETCTAATKTVITSQDQLPRRSYQLSRLPSELLDAPKSELDSLADALDTDLASDLNSFDIQSRAMRAEMLEARLQIAVHRGDARAAQELIRQVRAEQEKAADKLTYSVFLEAALEVRSQGGSVSEQRSKLKPLLAKSWGGMPWATVADNLKSTKASLDLFSRNTVVAGFKSGLDPAATNLHLSVPDSMLIGILSTRNAFELVPPYRDDTVAVLQELIDHNHVAKVDVWTSRLVDLPASASGTPVVVGIWDSGTDVDIFRPAKVRGIAFDEHMNPSPALVRPLGEAQARLPILKQYLMGMMDVQAAIDSPNSRAVKQYLSTLQGKEVEQFDEDMSAVVNWVHGTHVAGIALQGNPFARVTAVAMHFSSDSVPEKPDEASARRAAAAHRAAVASFKQAGARVVNMSWSSKPAGYERDLAYHNIGGTPDERQQLAKHLFDIQRQALAAAIAGAPQTLFVAASGNSNDDPSFTQAIPASLELPNLITVGAVDQAGTETSFSSFGKAVVVHANGFEVTSFAPGGEELKLSGTSMAAPQVANLAAKLFAMRPDLTVAQVKDLILKGAQRQGRVNLINPKATLALAGIKPTSK